MKKIIYYSALLAMTGMAMTGCQDDTKAYRGDGRVFINTSINSDVKVESRATAEDLSSSCIIWISSEKGLVRKYQGVENVPVEGIKLSAGHYVAEAWAGDSVSASWDARYYKGAQGFDVTSGDVTVNLRCTIANVLAAVNYDTSVDEALRDYTMTVSHARGSLVFEGRDERVASFMMPSNDKNLAWKLEGKNIKGDNFVKEGVIENVQPAHQYNLNVKYTASTSEVGGGYFEIVVDDSEVVVNDEVTIVSAPQISGYNFDINEQLVAEVGKVGRHSVLVAGATSLSSVVLSADNLSSLLGISGNDVDLLTMSEEVKTAIDAKGLNFIYTYDEENDLSTLKVNFEEVLTNALAEGEQTFHFKATDSNGKFTEKDFRILVTNASVTPVPSETYEIWPTSATLHGSILKAESTNVGFKYRMAGTSEWTFVAAETVDGTNYSAQISGLTPGKKYEYITVCDGFDSGDMRNFTTESATELTNGGFEDWNTSGSAYLLALNEASIFWDSGNHGSATMKKNVTQPEATIKKSGNYSAKLESQFVGIGSIGKFAAGNAFVGKYLDTQGTDGVLGFGRQFSTRPTSLHGYVFYTPAEVAYTSSSVPDVAKGDMDCGIIYVALLDGTTETYNGSTFPVIVQTKTAKLFDKNGANVIAYGELILEGTVTGEGGEQFAEFNIPLEYKRTDIVPSYMMIVCSASKNGDYFVGGPSVMYIDDFSFVY